MDRDVVQVFGRPKAIPRDAPWTSVDHTPGSRGSAGDQVPSIKNQVASPWHDREEMLASIPPPSTSPVDFYSLSSSSLESLSQDAQPRLRRRRRGLQPLTSIQTAPSNSNDSRPNCPPSVFVTTADPDRSRSNSRGLTDSAKEEIEEDPWVAWKRLSDATTTVVPSSSQTRRPSAIDLVSKGNLRPPSPKLRTKPFRPGLATHGTASPPDSVDRHVPQSIEVKFTRGHPSDDDPGQPIDAKGAASNEDEEADGNVVYLHSPSSRAKTLGLGLDLQPKIHSPTPKYAYAQSVLGLENAIAPSLSQLRAVTSEEEFKATGRKWFAEHRRRTGAEPVVMTPTSTTIRPSDIVSSADFKNLKVAMKEAEGEVEKKKGGVLADPLGRALCVFAVVLLVKILLK